MRQPSVRPGQWYRSVERPTVILRVVSVREMSPQPHAELVRVDDPTSVILLSVAALKDPNLYLYVDEG